MIKSITITNYLNETLELELAHPEKSGFAVLGIEGLEPPKANINNTQLATSDGSVYNSARAESRNIVLYLKFLANPTIEATRQLSYRFFSIKRLVTLTIESDDRISEVKGYIESNESSIFVNRTGTQVSIVCPASYLKSKAVFTTVVSGIQKNFIFPFSNESLTEDLIEFGVIRENNGVNTIYDGDKPCGLYISIKASGTVTNLMLYNATTREYMKIDTDRLTEMTGSAIIAGDVIEINTNKGEKDVLLFRDGNYINIINALDRDSTWLELQYGDNVFAYNADSGIDVVGITIRYNKLYEGV